MAQKHPAVKADSVMAITTPQSDSLKAALQAAALMALKAGPDSMTVFVKLVQVHQTDCPELEAQNKVLKKKKNTWQKIAGVLFVLATGHVVKVLTD